MNGSDVALDMGDTGEPNGRKADGPAITNTYPSALAYSMSYETTVQARRGRRNDVTVTGGFDWHSPAASTGCLGLGSMTHNRATYTAPQTGICPNCGHPMGCSGTVNVSYVGDKPGPDLGSTPSELM
jgi:hypothetical protein